MLAMQYEITLPGDYDMAIIRHRVATRGHALDAFPGLGLKAYLIRERGVDGSTRNQYAPFYLWRTVEGMNEFLWGPGFGRLSGDFGRPPVRQWVGLAFARGPAWTDTPARATRHIDTIPADADTAAAVADAADRAATRASLGGCHSTAVAIDPHRWQLVHFTLWADAPAGDGDRYEVLHLSAPESNGLAVGRHW